MKEILSLSFHNIRIEKHLYNKYDCFEIIIKSILEYYGFKHTDIILGKQLGFIYDTNKSKLYSRISSLITDMERYHKCRFIMNTEKSTKDLFDKLKQRAIAGHPTMVLTSCYFLPYRRDSIYKIPDLEKQKILDLKNRLENNEKVDEPIDRKLHYIAISGFDEENRSFHISDYPSVYEWIPEDTLALSLNSVFNDNAKNTWYDFRYEKQFMEYSTGSIIESMKRNCEFMLQVRPNDHGLLTGIEGIKKLAEDTGNWEALKHEDLKIAAAKLFDDHVPILTQRDAYWDFMKSAEKILNIDLSVPLDLILQNYKLHFRFRKYLWQLIYTDKLECVYKIKPLLLKIAEAEKMFLERIMTLIQEYELPEINNKIPY